MTYMEDKKKVTAALSAVWYKIKTEAEAIDKIEGKPFAQQVIRGELHAPDISLNLWRSSGRQAQMRMRTLMQRRMFQTSRLK